MFNKSNGKIVRYCRPTQVDGKGVLVSAFFLRKKNLELNRPEDEKTLSVDDFNFYETDNYKNIKSALLKRMSSAKAIKQITDIDIDIISEEKSSHCNITNLFGIDERAAVGFVQNILEIKQLKSI